MEDSCSNWQECVKEVEEEIILSSEDLLYDLSGV